MFQFGLQAVLGSIYWKNNDATKTNRNLKYRAFSVSGGYNTSVENVPFPGDYFELLNQVRFLLWFVDILSLFGS